LFVVHGLCSLEDSLAAPVATGRRPFGAMGLAPATSSPERRWWVGVRVGSFAEMWCRVRCVMVGDGEGGLGMLRYQPGCGRCDNWRHKHSRPAELGRVGQGAFRVRWVVGSGRG
jgi:hypothetical protein